MPPGAGKKKKPFKHTEKVDVVTINELQIKLFSNLSTFISYQWFQDKTVEMIFEMMTFSSLPTQIQHAHSYQHFPGRLDLHGILCDKALRTNLKVQFHQSFIIEYLQML